jgi:hypothetical protein
MSGVLGYVLGYDAGRSDAESSRQRHEVVDRIFYGCRPVQVDQSYLDNLHAALSAANASSDHNYDAADRFRDEALEWKGKAEQFHGEALYWRGRALPAEADAKALRAENASLHAQLAERAAALAQAHAAIVRERAAHQSTHDEKWGLDLFRRMATWLINAHIAGRSDRPAFAEMRDIAKAVVDAIERGEPFRGYSDKPEKTARLQALLEELLRP